MSRKQRSNDRGGYQRDGRHLTVYEDNANIDRS